jgi:hypothetical protein
VPGAETKEKQTAVLEKKDRHHRGHAVTPPPHYAIAAAERTPAKQEKKKGPGMGTVLLGLAIYLVSSDSSKRNS